MSNSTFIRNTVQAAGIKVVRANRIEGKGKRIPIGYGWVRNEGNVLTRSGKTYTTEDAAYAAAHKHFRLRPG